MGSVTRKYCAPSQNMNSHELKHSETGTQYLNCMTRQYFVTGIPKLDTLSQQSRGLSSGTILELIGGPRSGKTTISFHVMTTFVLPRPLGGHEKSIIYLDLDGRFDADRLRTTVLHRVEQIRGKDTVTKQNQNSNLVDACLKRVLVVKCPDAHLVNMALKQTNKLLSTLDVGLVVLSNLAGCFFDNRSRNACTSFGNLISKHLSTLRSQHRVVIIATTSTIFEKSNNHLLGNNWDRLTKYTIKTPLSLSNGRKKP